MSRFWKDPQNIIALGVTLISVCALIVSILGFLGTVMVLNSPSRKL